MIRLKCLMAISLICCIGIASAQPAAKQWMTVEQVRADVALAEEAYSRVHPAYTRYASIHEMSAAWSKIIETAEVEGGLPLGDFYLAVEEALVTIRCDHTKAELPQTIASERKVGRFYLPFRWDLIDGRGFVTIPGETSSLQRGDEILTIDGRTLEETVSAVLPYIPVDGYTDWARAGGVSQSLEFMGGAVDHFGALLWSPSETAELTLKRIDGSVIGVTLPRVGHDDWTAIGDGAGLARNFKDAVIYKPIGDDAAYLRIDTFVNYRVPVDPDEIYDPIFERMRDEGRDSLILDLRKNGGGSTDASQSLVAHLISEKMQTTVEMRVSTLDFDGLREHLWTWDSRALNPDPFGFKSNEDGSYSLRNFVSDDLAIVEPDPLAFTGRLIILTSRDNSSGSTNLISVLGDLGRAVTVGERTGGSAEGPTAGLIFTLTLPESGIKTRIPYFLQKNNVASFERGLGVTPDILAPMTVGAFLDERDPALEAAFSLIAAE